MEIWVINVRKWFQFILIQRPCGGAVDTVGAETNLSSRFLQNPHYVKQFHILVVEDSLYTNVPLIWTEIGQHNPMSGWEKKNTYKFCHSILHENLKYYASASVTYHR
ncbi:unnamed protein product [Lactuca saligna]|uniref:Uncharacterized protein n=1 Tax=Lactuca saligna TaxID=75948 RepID=A0AA35V865_LACSI|nr:unnamed protein product [Lactuca saligna]